MLYLHEIIDIIGDGQQAYLDTVIERAQHSEAQGISRLVGTFRVVGSTNRWPRVVNLWEMDSWTHWAQTLERQFLPEKKDGALAPWWSKAAQWRSGGFDRILEPAPYSPTLAALKEKNLRSWVCAHTIARTEPGASEPFLDAIKTEVLPRLAAHGVSLVGAYRVPMRSDEVVAIWAANDFRHLCSVYEKEANLLAMTENGSNAVREAETMWLVPASGCVLAPVS